MNKLLNFWKKPVQIVATTNTEKMSTFLHKANELFKLFLDDCSWFAYLIVAILILCCTYYYICDCKRRSDLRRRRESLQRANERIPQRRRPGAVYRDHQIFQNAIKTVHQYIGTDEKQPPNAKSYLLKKTRSGHVYGRISIDDGN